MTEPTPDPSAPSEVPPTSASAVEMITNDQSVLDIIEAALADDAILNRLKASLLRHTEQHERDVTRWKAERAQADTDQRIAIRQMAELRAQVAKLDRRMAGLLQEIKTKPKPVATVEKAIKSRTTEVSEMARAKIWRQGKNELYRRLRNQLKT